MKKPSPAQLAARKRFAEMARSGAFKKTAKREANPTMRPIIRAALNIRELAYDLENISQDDKKQISDYTDTEILHEAKYILEIYHESGTVSNDALMGEHGKDEQKSARDDVRKLKALIKKFGATTQRKANPVDTYIEKFHLGGKIYAQIIEKSDGTFDYYVYQMQATGISGEKPYEQFFDSKNYKTKSGAMRGLEKWAMRHQYKVTPQLHTNPAKKTVSQKISQLVHEGYPQRQAVAVALSEQRAGKVKRNPMGEIQAYAITRNFKVLGIFQTKQDAIKAAQGISDATGKTLAIKPVQVMAGHFNK